MAIDDAAVIDIPIASDGENRNETTEQI